MAGATTRGGWGARHQRLRRQWEPKVKTGTIDCHRCGEPIAPDQPWDLGHTDDRTAWTGPEHVRCNRAAGARASHAAQAGVSREW